MKKAANTSCSTPNINSEYIRAAIEAERNDIRTITKIIQENLVNDTEETDFPGTEHVTTVPNNKYVEYSSVAQRICALDRPPEITVLNMEFKQGGHVDPHKHDRVQTNFVLMGSYTDGVNGKTYHAGETQRIEPFQAHSMISDGCLVTVTWIPAFVTEEVKEKEKQKKQSKLFRFKCWAIRFYHQIKKFLCRVY